MQPSRPLTRGKKQTSTDSWEAALQFAKECRDKFEKRVGSVEDIERNSTAALELLAKR